MLVRPWSAGNRAVRRPSLGEDKDRTLWDAALAPRSCHRGVGGVTQCAYRQNKTGRGPLRAPSGAFPIKKKEACVASRNASRRFSQRLGTAFGQRIHTAKRRLRDPHMTKT